MRGNLNYRFHLNLEGTCDTFGVINEGVTFTGSVI
jgi:hypothetical protein